MAANQVSITITANPSGAIAAMKAVDDEANNQQSTWSKLSDAMDSTLGKSLKNTGIGFASLLGAGGLGGIGAAAGIAGLGIAGFAALAAPTLDKVKNALTQTGTAGSAAWAALDPTEKGIAQSIQKLEATFEQASKSFEPVVGSVVKLASTTATDLLPALTKLAPAGVAIITGFLTPMNKLLSSTWFSNWVTQIAHLATQEAPQLGQVMTQLLKVILQLFTALGPSGITSLVNIVSLFNQWVTALTPLLTIGSELLAWITQMMNKSPLLAAAILTVGAAIAVATGGLSLIIPLVALAVAAIMNLWDKSQTFREIVTQAFADVGIGVLDFGETFLDVLHEVVDVFMQAVHDILQGSVDMLGWVPGVGGKLKAALSAFDDFSTGVDNVFNAAHTKIEGWKTDLANLPKKVTLTGDISDLTAKLNSAKAQLKDPNLTATRRATIDADISQLEAQIAAARAQLNALNGMTAITWVKTISVTGTVSGGGGHTASGGTIPHAAAGGARGNLTWVGEHGPELVSLPGGSTVHSNPDAQQMMSGGGVANVVLSLDSSGAGELSDLIAVWFKKYVRAKGGGNVQTAFGRH